MASLLPNSTYRCSPLPFATPAQRTIAPPASLVEAVQGAVHQIEDSRLLPIVARTASSAFQPRVLLAILTYCYAQQIYGSAKIVDYISRDKAFRTACRAELPNDRELQSFRNQNRPAIERCLASALHFLVGQKVTVGFVTRIHETFIAEEAKRRIIMAACLDSMEQENVNQQPVEV